MVFTFKNVFITVVSLFIFLPDLSSIEEFHAIEAIQVARRFFLIFNLKIKTRSKLERVLILPLVVSLMLLPLFSPCAL